jgi:hypothetical protein
MVAAEQRGPFGPVPLQNLRPYYEPLRPCAPHRYSCPLGFSQLDFSLCIGTTGSHVPYDSLMRACAVYMPDAARAGSGYPPNLSRGFGVPPVSTSPDSYDISATVRLRSPSRILPAGIWSRLFRNAHHSRSLRPQLAVVWSLRLTAGSEGPTLISRTAPHLLYCWCVRDTPPKSVEFHSMRVVHSPLRNSRSETGERAVRETC